MSLTIHTDELSRLGYAREAVFGTPVADAGAFKEIITSREVRIDPVDVKIDLDQNRDSRILHLADVFNDTYSGPVVCIIPEMICTKDRFADMVFACTQNRIVQGAATSYEKVFALHASQPDFTASEGYFFTLAYRQPITGKDLKVTSCIVRKMEIDADKSAVGDKSLIHLKNVEIIGKKFSYGCTYSGTWSKPSTALAYTSGSFTFTDGTGTPAWLKFNLKLDNGAVPLDRDTDGTPKTFYLNPDHMNMASVELQHWYNGDTDTRDHITALESQLNLSCKFQGQIAAGSDGYVQIQWHGIIQGNPQGSDNKQMIIPAKHLIGQPANPTSALVSGQVYKLVDWKTDDDFANVDTVLSGTTNTDGEIFLATGTTPTKWLAGSVVEGYALTITIGDSIDQGAGA
jgi:hypothetical protein